MKNNFENNQVDLSESLKVVRETVSSIRKKINNMAAQQEQLSIQEQPIFECIHGILSSQSHLLLYMHHYAKNPEEIQIINLTQDLVKQACAELKVLAGVNDDQIAEKSR